MFKETNLISLFLVVLQVVVGLPQYAQFLNDAVRAFLKILQDSDPSFIGENNTQVRKETLSVFYLQRCLVMSKPDFFSITGRPPVGRKRVFTSYQNATKHPLLRHMGLRKRVFELGL